MENLQVLAFRTCSLILTQHFSNQTSPQEETGKILTAQNGQDQNNGVASHSLPFGSASPSKYECHGNGVSEAIHAHRAFLGVMEAGGSVVEDIRLHKMTVGHTGVIVMHCTVIVFFEVAKINDMPNSEYIRSLLLLQATITRLVGHNCNNL